MMFGNITPPTGRSDRDVRSQIIDMFAVELINDPTTPPDVRASVEVFLEAKKFDKKLRDFVVPASKNILFNDDPKVVQKVNDIIEYIRLMSAGLDSFMEAWKHE